jgi:hypothetical protein
MASISESLATRLYYRFKPLIPVSIRWMIRRRRAYSIRESSKHFWPISEEAGKTPDGWKGWPDGKRFAFVLTHDVEGASGLSKVNKLAELEKGLGFRASFNFIPEGEYRVTRKTREWLAQEGFEVGVHDLEHDGRLYDSRSSFNQKAKRINSYLNQWAGLGFRSGFMMRQLEWLHELEIEYDSSTFDTDPFEPQPEGCRTIFPFMVTSDGIGSKSSYVELPYTLPQDSTLFLLLEEKSAEVWKRKLDWIVEHGGMALVNIHPDYIDFGSESGSESFSYPDGMIEDFLNYVESRYGGEYWNPLPAELAAWYKNMNGLDTCHHEVPRKPLNNGSGR